MNACEDKKHFEINLKTPIDKIQLNTKLDVNLKPLTDKIIDSATYSFQNQSGKVDNQFQIDLNNVLLGKHKLKSKFTLKMKLLTFKRHQSLQ